MKKLLKAKQLGAYVLIPVVTTKEDQCFLSLVFQIGEQGNQKFNKIDASKLNVKLLDTKGHPLEMIRQPASGLLGIRGSRSMQSTANFVFSSSGSDLQTLEVTLGSETIHFDFFSLFETKNEFTDIPKKGDRFPFRQAPRNFVERLLYYLLDFLRAIYLFFRRLFCKHCCVERFEAPLNSAVNGDERYFEMEADFKEEGSCKCSCCRYAQYLSGSIVDAAGNDVDFPLPDGLLDSDTYREDGVIDEFGNGNHGFYGDRGHIAQAHDQYLPNQADGCQYRGSDTPRMLPGDVSTFNFVGLIIDTCEGTVKDVKSWTVSWP